MKHSQKGFTLLEILVVIAIIGILSSVVGVFLTSANNKAKSALIQSDLSQVQKQATIYITSYGDYGSPTRNGGNNFVWPCAQDGVTGGSPWVWAMNNPGYASTMFGSTTADGSLLNLINDLKNKSGWTNNLPTVFCIGFGNTRSTSWAISVRDPSNTGNYFCADSSGNVKYEVSAPITSPPYNTYPSPTNNFAGIVSNAPGIATCQ
jgi:prepilin-type N-terminal cleavage/methylation domain-containing protein